MSKICGVGFSVSRAAFVCLGGNVPGGGGVLFLLYFPFSFASPLWAGPLRNERDSRERLSLRVVVFMPDYQAMYLTLFQASEEAINLLIQAQQQCEELYLSAPEPELEPPPPPLPSNP